MRFLRTLLLSVVAAISVPNSVIASDKANESRPVPAISGCASTDDFERTGYDGKSNIKRVICADIVAHDQLMVYNRFGSFNPFGMMFSLRRDMIAAAQDPLSVKAGEKTDEANALATAAKYCKQQLGTEYHLSETSSLSAGKVRLQDCKRPRPLTLRASVGDVLQVNITNLLSGPETIEKSEHTGQPGYTETFCRSNGVTDATRKKIRDSVAQDEEKDCKEEDKEKSPETLKANAKEKNGNWPRTRHLSFTIKGLVPIKHKSETKINDVCLGLSAIDPNVSTTCYYSIDREGPYFLASTAAPAGGQGFGGSLTHGLFGAVVVEQSDTEWYRSQVAEGAFNKFWPKQGTVAHQRQIDPPNYNVKDTHGQPILNLLRPVVDQAGNVKPNSFELFHNELNAIIWRAETLAADGKVAKENVSFREFSVFFHDELKTFYTRNFRELEQFDQLAGGRDGFGINYGASGMGAMLLANRKGIGPAADCMECLYEEFFLQSWANGDPALLENYPEDPSNVHHSYLNDPVVFRNFHAGPKETHVFHLHAHQWFSGDDSGRGSYLDSQTVGPQQGFSYNIYHGGLSRYEPTENVSYRPGYNKPKGKGWWSALGAGNRNRSPGDSIFHCHLYPHFAQGMWELWRNHDVLEDGSRLLPDGQATAELSVNMVRIPGEPVPAANAMPRRGTSPLTGPTAADTGTPIPGIIPLPDKAAPLLPTYGKAGMPGYPFYLEGEPGHRSPQAPLDIATNNDKATVPNQKYLDGGLARHIVLGGADREFGIGKLTLAGKIGSPELEKNLSQYAAKMLALADMTAHLTKAKLKLLPYKGSDLELRGMGFHYNGKIWNDKTDGQELDLKTAHGAKADYLPKFGSYQSIAMPKPDQQISTTDGLFPINGAPPKPGAPFADPCGAPDGYAGVKRNGKDDYVYSYNSKDYPLFSEASFAADDALTDDEVDVVEQLRKNRHRKIQTAYYKNDNGEAVEIKFDLFEENDPFVDKKFAPDPAVIGYRRYEGSAVQVDLITNTAGWHDPQGRINVLTEKSHHYKDPEGTKGKGISPTSSAREEPFFFRALSGECIEFRHTNELPKDLERDDFQVKTPTDTIGQHIHLVKFDVTSSDGSGNGFNYEDGTFAADELAARICASTDDSEVANGLDKAALPDKSKLCERASGPSHVKAEYKDIWRRAMTSEKDGKRVANENRALFQTTVQRWFADPILSDDGADGLEDRTMRTVFTHDHFGPSSIQQHGFYNALVIEHRHAKVSPSDKTSPANCEGDKDTMEPRAITDRELKDGNCALIGTRKIVTNMNGDNFSQEASDKRNLHPDVREFAVAIADFALLYDPRERHTLLDEDDTNNKNGLACLWTELDTRKECNPPKVVEKDKPLVPAEAAAGTIVYDPDIKKFPDIVKFKEEARDFAEKANGKPVAPPERPESISVDHHDPYLVNYKGEPVPLRIGESENQSNCAELNVTEGGLITGTAMDGASLLDHVKSKNGKDCSIKRQKKDEAGDLAFVFQTKQHKDPATPIFHTYSEDRVVMRLIQGAQEVQHTFNVEGMQWPRNIDQKYGSAARQIETINPSTRWSACRNAGLSGKPIHYDDWRTNKNYTDPFYTDYAKLVAGCDNVEGLTPAQEIGISEHFEFNIRARNDANLASFRISSESKSDTKSVREPADYLYHFGTQDALWNGAWGLLRVMDPNDNRIELNFLGNDIARNDFLNEIEKKATATSSSTVAPDEISEGFDCPASSPRVTSHLVAIQNRDFGFLKTNYDRRREIFDGDGLSFVAIDPPEIVSPNQKPTKAELRRKVIASLTDASNQLNEPKPPVLRANAGDCISFNLYNLLPQQPYGGLRDALGDARMPPIVPLNVEPTWRKASDDPRIFVTEDNINVRPSSRLTVMVPLPQLRPLQETPWPFGINETEALASESSASLPASFAFKFYAGKLWLDRTAFNKAVAGETFDVDGTPQPRIAACEAAKLKPANKDGEGVFSVLGAYYTAKGSKREDRTACIKAAEEALLVSHPYAAGALNIKAMGDMFGHTTHGLIGALVVEPQGATYPGRNAADTSITLSPTNSIAQMAIQVPRIDFAPGKYIAKKTLKEHVLFFQDGLNLRDQETKSKWISGDDYPKIMEDCMVCDDSYDFGDKGVSGTSAPFFARLRDYPNTGHPEAYSDLNEVEYPKDFFSPGKNPVPVPITVVEEGDEVIMRVLHPGGRARQRAFVTVGNDYDDVYPGFGFPHSALLAPGKGITAAFSRPVSVGCYMWHDGPNTLWSGGTWGLIDVRAKPKPGQTEAVKSSCGPNESE